MKSTDEGLQPERTLLAWRRTCLSLAVACAVAVKLLAPGLGPIVAVPGLLGLVCLAIPWSRAAGNYWLDRQAVADGSHDRRAVGLTAYVVFLTCVVLAATALLFVVACGPAGFDVAS